MTLVILSEWFCLYRVFLLMKPDGVVRRSTLGLLAWNLLPFSRGSVQITVSDVRHGACVLHSHPTL